MDFALELQTISLVGENYFFNYYIFTQVRSWAHENNFEKNVKSYYSLPIMLFALLFLYWEEYNAPIIHYFKMSFLFLTKSLVKLYLVFLQKLSPQYLNMVFVNCHSFTQ